MSDLPLFLGRFHPVLVHLPIGLLVAAGVLEAWAWWRRRGGRTSAVDSAVGALHGLAAAGAVAAAAAGALLEANGGYSGNLAERHKVLGFGLAASTVLTAGAWLVASRRSGRRWQVVYGLLLVNTLALLAGAGHAGGALTHGEDYLTELAPEWLRAWAAPEAAASGAGSPRQRRIFEALVQPVLQKRCVSCHGAESPQGGLRLDGVEGILGGGEGGAVVTPGRPGSSALWKRVSLPTSHRDVMPPRGRRSVTAAEGALLRWWIAEGASFEATLGEVEVPPDVRPTVEALLGPLPAAGPTLPPVTVASPDPGALAAAEAAGYSVAAIAEGVPFVQVGVAAGRGSVGDAEVAALAPLAAQIVWLDLGGTSVGDAGLEAVGALGNLVRLDVSRTAITDAGLTHLSALGRLETLNLYGTGVTDAGLVRLETLASLRRLYLWQTATTVDGVARLRSALPDLEADAGSDRAGS